MTLRQFYAWLAAGLMVFTVYVSLLPFRLEAVPLDLAWRHFVHAMTTWPDRVPRANFLANVLLFVPIGFGLAGARLADREGQQRGPVAMALLFGLAVSLVAEFLQVFAPGRITSLADVAAQSAGCGVGLALWALSGRAFTVWVRESCAARTGHQRFTRVLVGYVALWLFASWAPFDITLDPRTLAARVRQGLIAVVPFAQPVTPRLLWDAAVTVIGAVPIGMLAVSGWWTRPARRSVVTATVLAAGGIAAVEATQVFIRSHAADATDIVCGAIGAIGGVYVGTRLWGSQLTAPVGTQRSSHWAWVGFALWCLMLGLYHWQPFDFAIDEALVRQKIARISLVPFSGYAAGSDLGAFNDLVAKTAVALPLGLVAAFALPRAMGGRLAAAVWIVLAAAVFGLLEVGQFFLPSRVSDPTDVWVGMAASSAGLWLGRWLRGADPDEGRVPSTERRIAAPVGASQSRSTRDSA